MSDQIKNQEVLLRVEDLCQYFGPVKAVDGVSFEVYKGEVFGLVGESGCGKTTTGRSIIKIYDITSGSIYFKGQRICAGTRSYKEALSRAKKMGASPEEIGELRSQIKQAQHDHKHSDSDYALKLIDKIDAEYLPKIESAKQRDPGEYRALLMEYRNRIRIAKKSRLVTQIQMIFQDPIASLNPRMTVKEIIAEGMVINGIRDEKYIEEKVFEILETVGLVREHAGRYPHEFSGGQRQRIGIARAVVMNPELLIADEPISALDVSIQAQIINLLNDLRHKLGLTILFIAHDLSVVKYFSDRIGVMYYVKMVELSTADELFEHPLHPYTRSLLSAIPLPDPHSEKNRKRIVYNKLADHDYSVDKPTMREITPGHFVYCNDAEEKKYRTELGL